MLKIFFDGWYENIRFKKFYTIRGFGGILRFEFFFREGVGGDFLRFEKFFEVRLAVRGGGFGQSVIPLSGGGGPKMAKSVS